MAGHRTVSIKSNRPSIDVPFLQLAMEPFSSEHIRLVHAIAKLFPPERTKPFRTLDGGAHDGSTSGSQKAHSKSRSSRARRESSSPGLAAKAVISSSLKKKSMISTSIRSPPRSPSSRTDRPANGGGKGGNYDRLSARRKPPNHGTDTPEPEDAQARMQIDLLTLADGKGTQQTAPDLPEHLRGFQPVVFRNGLLDESLTAHDFTASIRPERTHIQLWDEEVK